MKHFIKAIIAICAMSILLCFSSCICIINSISQEEVMKYKINKTFPNKGDNELFVFPDSVNILINNSNFQLRYYSQFYSYPLAPWYVDKNEKAYHYKNSNIFYQLKNLLEEHGYVDTMRRLTWLNNNAMLLQCNIKSAIVNVVENTICYSSIDEKYMQAYIEIDWILRDCLNKEVLKYSCDSSKSNWKKTIEESINEAFQFALIDFLNSSETKKILAEKTSFLEYYNQLDTLAIKISNNKKELDKMIESLVTVQTNKGHGSGCIISSDGYIITNHHVIARTDSSQINILYSNGKMIQGKVVRSNPEFDLALIKIDTTNITEMYISDLSMPQLGEDVYTIGTPFGLELGQTVSKGIISGQRSFNNINYIQIDASINSGNSGGALISMEKGLLGIVNAKLIGVGVEGMGFAIPINYLEEALKIKLIE